jgi:AAA domain
MSYSRAFSRNIGYTFHAGSIRLTALTGTAATEIKGETTAREFHLMKKNYSASPEDIEDFKDTRLCVVDEISFADHDLVLSKMNENLRMLTQCFTRTYGEVPIVFLGDFCQLESIGNNTIFSHDRSVYWEQALTSMVELKGTHRYSKCEDLKNIMPGLRERGMSPEARKLFNSRVVDGINVKLPNIATAKFATYHNKNRCEYNQSVFLAYLKEHHTGCDEHHIPKSAIVIKATASWTKSKESLSFGQRKVIFENCTDADVTDHGRSKHCDPMLTLFTGCQMMGTCNDDVRNGVANGTTSLFKKIVFKPGKRPTPMKLHGYWIYSVNADDVEHVLMEWHESQFEGRFIMKPRSNGYQVAFPIVENGHKMKVRRTGITFFQFPLLVNHATTGHKLQGKTLDALIIAEWSKVKNWAYVVLSRVRSLAGLYLLRPIPADIDFSPDPRYVEMMERLRQSKLRTPNDAFVNDMHNSFEFPSN